MTYVHTETLSRDVAELVEDWDLANCDVTKNVRPGEWDDSFNLQDLEFIYEHINIG